MKRLLLLAILIFQYCTLFSQSTDAAKHWADSVFKSLTTAQRIAQTMIIRAHSNLGQKHTDEVTELIQKYNVGGLCFFQGGPVRQAKLTNHYQSLAQTPLMITIDGEWGLGMRLDSVQNLPRQLMLGAVSDASLAYRYGTLLAAQCRRMGIQVDYAPVVDINNNPANPVINDRSFGEDKYRVSLLANRLIRGLQDQGVMACAKHFPGHGDTETDSHYDLPLIQKKRAQLDSLELYPFRQVFEEGVGSTMVGHLAIPDIDATPHIATSISKNNVTSLLKQELGFKGLVFTDAIEMKGVQKYFPGAAASVKALQAGNDMLCLPVEIPATIKKIKSALFWGKIKRKTFHARVKKILEAKYNLGLHQMSMTDTLHLTEDLNQETPALLKDIATHSITLLRNEKNMLPLSTGALAFLATSKQRPVKVAYVAFGTDTLNTFCREMKRVYDADIFFYSYQHDAGNVPSMIEMLSGQYDYVVMGMHRYSRRPANHFGIGAGAMRLIQALSVLPNSILVAFGNPYVLANFCDTKNLITSYEDNAIIQSVTMEVLTGKLNPSGQLPVTVCPGLPVGTGLRYEASNETLLPRAIDTERNFSTIDAIVGDAIKKKAMPGAVVLVVHKGKIVFEKAYGHTTYDSIRAMKTDNVFDLASVTKVLATTLSVMKLYEEGKLELNQRLGYYLPELKGTMHDSLAVRDLLLHQSGLAAWIPFYKAYIDSATGVFLEGMASGVRTATHPVRVASGFYVSSSLQDTVRERMIQSGIPNHRKYVYSDLNFIYLGKIVERLTGTSLDQYVRKVFYEPTSLHRFGYLPLQKVPLNEIVPTEHEKSFRRQLLWGDVHDPAAALMGGVAGHAGLFGTAYEAALLMQMLMNGGTIGGEKYLEDKTIALFTAYGSDNSRRGLGFDKPERDNEKRAEPYPCQTISPEAFGHTGFTGTCVWADPKHKIVFVLLSHRVHPAADNTLFGKMNVRGKVQEAVYGALLSGVTE